jgi:hypothetical protein
LFGALKFKEVRDMQAVNPNLSRVELVREAQRRGSAYYKRVEIDGKYYTKINTRGGKLIPLPIEAPPLQEIQNVHSTSKQLLSTREPEKAHKGFFSPKAPDEDQKGHSVDVLDTLRSTDQTILQLVDAAKRASHYLSAEAAVASRLLKVEGKTPTDKATLKALRAYVLDTLSTEISVKISSLGFKKKSPFEEKDAFAKDSRNTIAKIKQAMVVYFKLAEKTYGPDYQSPSKSESRWDSRIASVEYALPEERSVFSRITGWIDDLFTSSPNAALKSSPDYSQVSYGLRTQWNQQHPVSSYYAIRH